MSTIEWRQDDGVWITEIYMPETPVAEHHLVKLVIYPAELHKDGYSYLSQWFVSAASAVDPFTLLHVFSGEVRSCTDKEDAERIAKKYAEAGSALMLKFLVLEIENRPFVAAAAREQRYNKGIAT